METAVLSVSCHDRQGEELVKVKQRLVSQVLEIGIIFHSVIIGVTMGMSQNQCTIRPLIAALSFHQIFEGLGLGGCIAQVNHQNPSSSLDLDPQEENSKSLSLTATSQIFVETIS